MRQFIVKQLYSGEGGAGASSSIGSVAASPEAVEALRASLSPPGDAAVAAAVAGPAPHIKQQGLGELASFLLENPIPNPVWLRPACQRAVELAWASVAQLPPSRHFG